VTRTLLGRFAFGPTTRREQRDLARWKQSPIKMTTFFEQIDPRSLRGPDQTSHGRDYARKKFLRLATPSCLSIAKRGAQLEWPELSSRRPSGLFDQLADEVENCGALRGSLPSWDPGLMAVFLIGTALIGMELTTVRPFHVACLIEGLFNDHLSQSSLRTPVWSR
jgi:hypothetical protein